LLGSAFLQEGGASKGGKTCELFWERPLPTPNEGSQNGEGREGKKEKGRCGGGGSKKKIGVWSRIFAVLWGSKGED